MPGSPSAPGRVAPDLALQRPPLVLVADDDADSRDLVGAQLRSCGYEVVYAHDGEHALALSISRHPDLALVDIRMPKLDGFELTEQLRANEETSHISVLFLSGSAGPEDVARAYAAGADDYLKKPVSDAELRARVGLALQRSIELAYLREAARVDPLTGLPNRHAWETEFVRELMRSARTSAPLCLGMFDLDRFKQFNDLHGHQLGDQLLVETVSAWQAQLRQSDFLARYGGDEFCVLLPDCSTDGARRVLERVVSATPRGQTCSGGVAEWDRAEPASELLRRADGALYEAKGTGGDSLVAA